MIEAGHTTLAVQHYLDELGEVQGTSPAEPIIRSLLSKSIDRLQLLCSTMLYRSYPRLTRPPLNLQTEEILSAVVERLIKAMQKIRPQTVRQFFALANQHLRWELNDLARRLDEQTPPIALNEANALAQESSGSGLNMTTRRILEVIESLPEDEREVFSLTRIQGLSHSEAAQLLDISTKTVQRRLNRSLMLLARQLGDLGSV